MQRDRAPPEMPGSRAEISRIGGMIDAAHFDVRVSLRHAQTLYALAINKNCLGDRGRLAHQSQESMRWRSSRPSPHGTCTVQFIWLGIPSRNP